MAGYKNQGIKAGKEKNARITESKGRENPAPRIMDGLNGHLHNKNNRPISGRANPGSSERDHGECVCKRGKSSCRRTMCINSNQNNCRYKRPYNK